jgi:hypothetical protein
LFKWCPSHIVLIPLFPLGAHRFHWSLALRQAREYVRVVRALTPLASTSASLEIIFALQAFHPSNLSLSCLDFLMEFQPNTNLEFSLYMFKSAFIHSSHLLAREPSNMVFEQLYMFTQIGWCCK